MASDDYSRTAPKMGITNMVTGDTLTAQYNPAELSESLGAAYARLQVPGFSGTRKHFSNTEDPKYSFSMYFTSLEDSSADALQTLLDARQFLASLVHPVQSGTIAKGGAPKVLFVWPQIISVVCVLTKATLKYTQFNSAGAPTVLTAAVEVEELRDTFIGMQDILDLGSNRGGSFGGGDS